LLPVLPRKRQLSGADLRFRGASRNREDPQGNRLRFGQRKEGSDAAAAEGQSALARCVAGAEGPGRPDAVRANSADGIERGCHSMSWTRITTLESLPLREGRCVDLGDREIALFNLGGQVAAIDANCPHRGGPLCDGIVTGSVTSGQVRGHAVVCPLHGWRIDLTTGNVLRPDVSV